MQTLFKRAEPCNNLRLPSNEVVDPIATFVDDKGKPQIHVILAPNDHFTLVNNNGQILTQWPAIICSYMGRWINSHGEANSEIRPSI